MEKLTKEQRRKNMQANKSTGTKPELLLAKTLFARGHRYRKNDKTVFGKPDLTFKKIKLAIFVDGEFWHGKDWNERKNDHKTNQEFWHKKIDRNIDRDIEVNEELTKQGWSILQFWGKEIENNLLHCVLQIEGEIKNLKMDFKEKISEYPLSTGILVMFADISGKEYLGVPITGLAFRFNLFVRSSQKGFPLQSQTHNAA